MIGYNVIKKVEQLHTLAKECGFTIKRDPYFSSHLQGIELISLFPAEDETVLPIYNRDMPIYTGDLDACITFLHGWGEAIRYHNILGFENRRKVAEDKQYRDLQFAKLKKAINGSDNV